MRILKGTAWLKLLAVSLLLGACCNKDLDVAKYEVAIASEIETQNQCLGHLESLGGVAACKSQESLLNESAADYEKYCAAYCVDPNGPEYNTCRGKMTIADYGQPSCVRDDGAGFYEVVCATVIARCTCEEACDK